MKYDLHKLKAGELSSLSFSNDLCIGLEPLPETFAPENANGRDEFDSDVIENARKRYPWFSEKPSGGMNAVNTFFKKRLIATRCGIIVMEDQARQFQTAVDSTVQDDINNVMALAESFRIISMLGACSCRYAGFLMEPDSGITGDVPPHQALCLTLGVLSPVFKVSPIDDDYYDGLFSNGVTSEPDLDMVDLSDEAAAGQEAIVANKFSVFSNREHISLGTDDAGFTRYYIVPVFLIGWTPCHRLGGLITGFVY